MGYTIRMKKLGAEETWVLYTFTLAIGAGIGYYIERFLNS